MKILILILASFTSLVQGQDFDLEIENLNSDSYASREKSYSILLHGMLTDPKVLVLIRESLKSQSISLEQRDRLQRLESDFYTPLLDVNVSIWSLPDYIRFQGKRDIALEYYKKAQLRFNDKEPEGIYNHSLIMRYATKLYFLDQLEGYERRRSDLNKLSKDMNNNWKFEQKLLMESLEQNVCYCGSYIYVSDKPKSLRDRLMALRAYKKDVEEDGYSSEFPEGVVVDHDEIFDMYCY